MTWTYRPDLLASTLEAAGFDVDRSTAETIGGGGSLTGRRERAERAVLVAVDAGGRVRIAVTTRLGETAGSETLGGVALRAIEETTRTRTLTGRLAEPVDLARVVEALDRPTGGRGRGETPGPNPPEPPGQGDEPR
jgi:hypothetical protein